MPTLPRWTAVMRLLLLIAVLLLGLGSYAVGGPTLVGFARLALDTFRSGPTGSF